MGGGGSPPKFHLAAIPDSAPEGNQRKCPRQNLRVLYRPITDSLFRLGMHIRDVCERCVRKTDGQGDPKTFLGRLKARHPIRASPSPISIIFPEPTRQIFGKPSAATTPSGGSDRFLFYRPDERFSEAVVSSTQRGEPTCDLIKKGLCSGCKDLSCLIFCRGTGIRTRDLQLPKLAR